MSSEEYSQNVLSNISELVEDRVSDMQIPVDKLKQLKGILENTQKNFMM